MAMHFADERGVALPMAVMSLALLVPLMLAFASLSVSEPIIAANQLRATQARTLADSGLQYALWALSRPTSPGGLPFPLSAPPLDGRTFITVGVTGGFTVQVAAHEGGDPQARTITAVGWAPAPGPFGMRAHRQIVADAVAVPHPGARAPCALCVRGALDVRGNVAIDGTNRDPACGNDTKFGAFTTDATTVGGPAVLSGGAGGSAEQQPADAFDAVKLSPAALDALRAIALRSGTYYGPGFPNGGLASDGGTTWQGRIVFDAANPLPDGVVFIDTTDGGSLDTGGAITSLAGARLDAVAATDGIFRGWIIVNGSLEITAGLHLRGLVYAVDTLSYRATGEGSIEGLAVALNVGDTPTRIEAAAGGGMRITFDCRHAGGEGLVPHGFALIPGTYREERD
jgi:hypothetical protein